jgi:hypothetical protein
MEEATDFRPDGRTGGRLRVAVLARGAHPSHYVVRDLVEALTSHGAVAQRPLVGEGFGRLLAKARGRSPAGLRHRSGPIVVPMMGARFGQLYSAALTGDVVPVCWDVWEPQWALWAARLQPLRPPVVFVTAAQSACFLDGVLPRSQVLHLPEATRVSRYSPQRALADRAIGVLELGRRHQKWHDTVSAALALRPGRTHVYENSPGALAFADERALIEGLADSVISVCFPSSLTHPQRSGTVETMTHRYLESMASGCLVLGHAPAELIRLMGYNPVIEVDWSDPVRQVLTILEAPDRWQHHVDQALRKLRETGDWSLRARAVRTAIEATGR